jgi:hypothetical protein
MDMKQYRYLNFDKSHPLILNYQEKVLGYVTQKFWSFLEISGAFFGISQNKVVTKTGVSEITKFLNTNPILTSHNYIQKIIASMTCF